MKSKSKLRTPEFKHYYLSHFCIESKSDMKLKWSTQKSSIQGQQPQSIVTLSHLKISDWPFLRFTTTTTATATTTTSMKWRSHLMLYNRVHRSNGDDQRKSNFWRSKIVCRPHNCRTLNKNHKLIIGAIQIIRDTFFGPFLTPPF